MCLAVPGRILSIANVVPGGPGVPGVPGVPSGPGVPSVPGGPSAATAAPTDTTDTTDTADTAIPGTDVDLWRTAEVDFGGVRQRVSLACLPDARVGDQVLVHVGFALSLVDDTLEVDDTPEIDP
jgi:hydrogenase expression/formation protein HypC